MKNVLVISDDQQLLSSLQALLPQHGFLINTTAGREDVLTEIAQLQPDLIVVDFLLGEVNGGALCHQIRCHYAIKHLPVILMSDYPNIERFTGKFGCNAIVSKPVNLRHLLQAFNTTGHGQFSASQALSRAS